MEGRLVVEDDDYWCRISPLWGMPHHIENSFIDQNCRLAIFKGERNYFRMLGYLDTADESSFSDALSKYWSLPVSVCSLRVFDSELGFDMIEKSSSYATRCSLRDAQLEDQRWFLKGSFGTAQFHSGISNS